MRYAAEQRPLDLACDQLPVAEQHARLVINRINALRSLPEGARIADVGAGQGLFLIACAQMGYDAVGIEPWADARSVAEELAALRRVRISIVSGTMESIPLPSASVDVVHANSVVEHVADVRKSFAEVYRVLKPGGMFWFSTASSLCPRQGEIRGFPLFGWYPDALKTRIMDWAKEHRPALIAHTSTPAYHWFTPPKARRMLTQAGFTKIYDRWDIRLPSEGGAGYRLALRVIKSSSITKFVADVFVPTCAYLAVK